MTRPFDDVPAPWCMALRAASAAEIMLQWLSS
jgi:hypothetical protein